MDPPAKEVPIGRSEERLGRDPERSGLADGDQLRERLHEEMRRMEMEMANWRAQVEAEMAARLGAARRASSEYERERERGHEKGRAQEQGPQLEPRQGELARQTEADSFRPGEPEVGATTTSNQVASSSSSRASSSRCTSSSTRRTQTRTTKTSSSSSSSSSTTTRRSGATNAGQAAPLDRGRGALKGELEPLAFPVPGSAPERVPEPAGWTPEPDSPLVRLDEATGERLLRLRFDVAQFQPDELVVRTVGERRLQVEAESGGVGANERGAQHHYRHHLRREFLLPEGAQADRVSCSLSADGQLTVEAPLRS